MGRGFDAEVLAHHVADAPGAVRLGAQPVPAHAQRAVVKPAGEAEADASRLVHVLEAAGLHVEHAGLPLAVAVVALDAVPARAAAERGALDRERGGGWLRARVRDERSRGARTAHRAAVSRGYEHPRAQSHARDAVGGGWRGEGEEGSLGGARGVL